MPVVERPVVNLLTFQVWDRDKGTWNDLADKATAVSIQRGAKQTGAKVETQVGTLDATLYGALDLRRVSDLQPNSPIRVIRPRKAPGLAWDLMPSGSDAVATKGAFARSIPVTQNGAPATRGFGASAFNSSVQQSWSNNATTFVAPGVLLFTSPNTWAKVPTNPKPVGLFDPGDTYTVRGRLISNNTSITQRLRAVVWTGNANLPTILAQSDPITLTSSGADIGWSFVAPDNDDWNLGIVSVDAVSATSARYDLFNFTVDALTIWDTGRQRPEFTGTIADLAQTVEYDKRTGTKRVYTTVQAVDAVQSLANTDRYGVIARGGAGFQTWADRISQLAGSALVPIAAPVEADYVLFDQTAKIGTNAYGWNNPKATMSDPDPWYNGGGNGSWNLYRGGSKLGASTFEAVRITQALRGLDTSATHAAVLTVTVTQTAVTATGDWCIGWADASGAVTYGDPITMSTSNPQAIALRFQPTTANVTVGVFQRTQGTISATSGARMGVAITDMRVVRPGQADPYLLQDVAFQSSLLNHFDLACNSVGARWYVTKRGTALFRRRLEDVAPAARFTDSDLGDVSYTDVSLGFDTRNVVNSIKLNQHGYDPASGNAADTAVTFTSDLSIARWGARASELDTCLYLGTGHQNDGYKRAVEIMDPLRRPRYAVSSFTINVQSKPDVLDALELRAAVAIDYENLRQTSRVLAIRHTITPTRWLVTVDVNETRVGARFSDLLTAGHTTFSALDAKYRGTSFRDFNADPLR